MAVHNRVRSFLLLLGTNVITKACWAITLLLLLRHLGVQSFGALATLWSAATIAAGFTDLGAGQVLLREGSRDHALARNLALQAATVQLVMTFMVAALLAISGWWLLPIPELTPLQRASVIILSVLTPLVDCFQALFTVFSQIGGSYATYSRVRSARFVALLLCLTAVVICHGGLVAVSITYFLITAIFAVLMASSTWPMLPPRKIGAEAIALKRLVMQGLPFLTVMTLTLAYGRVEVTILGSWGQTTTAGAYHVIYQLVLLIYTITGMFFTVIYPRLYRHHGNSNALAADFRDTVRWLSLLAWLTAPPMCLYAEPLLRLMGGDTLATYAALLRVLSLLILLIPASAALNFLLPMDMLGKRIACDMLGIGTTIAGTTYAATTDRPLIAAIAAVTGYACAMLGAHIALRRMLQNSGLTFLTEFLRIGICTAPVSLVTWLVPVPWWLRTALFIMISVLLLLTSRHPISYRVRFWLTHKHF